MFYIPGKVDVAVHTKGKRSITTTLVGCSTPYYFFGVMNSCDYIGYIVDMVSSHIKPVRTKS